VLSITTALAPTAARIQTDPPEKNAISIPEASLFGHLFNGVRLAGEIERLPRGALLASSRGSDGEFSLGQDGQKFLADCPGGSGDGYVDGHDKTCCPMSAAQNTRSRRISLRALLNWMLRSVGRGGQLRLARSRFIGGFC
jgi:hypothetical protein